MFKKKTSRLTRNFSYYNTITQFGEFDSRFRFDLDSFLFLISVVFLVSFRFEFSN